MKFNFLIFGLLFLFAVHCQQLLAELQGPHLELPSEIRDGTTGDDTSSEDKSISNNEKTNVRKDHEKDETISNERKSAKYIADQQPKSPAANLPVTKSDLNVMLETNSKEKFAREKQIVSNLIEQIKEIKNNLADSSHNNLNNAVQEMKGNSRYERAKNLLANLKNNKDVSFLLKDPIDFDHEIAFLDLAWASLFGQFRDIDLNYAVSVFDSMANAGIPEAHLGLAYSYSIGIGGKNVSQPLALIHYTLSALGDDIYAQMALGYRYSFGINVPVNCEKSLMYYKSVAKKVAKEITFSNGPVIHRVHLLDEAENPGSHESEIVDYYQLLADKGDVQSQVGLGHLYYQGGKVIQRDHQKALEYFTQAANAGNAVGYAFLGKIYLEGSEFIKADNDTAFKAADLGDPVGQSGLGYMYSRGLGVPKDSVKARNYFTKAADQGWVDGQLYLGYMYASGDGVKRDYKLAHKYFSLASQSGHVLAYYNLGIMNSNGMGMPRSCPAAVEFFKNVAERGRWSSALMTAYKNYKHGNADVAYMQYSFFAELGYEVAQSNSAFLLDREDVKIFNNRHEELIRAFYYWKRSAAQGYSAAQVKLGDYYYYGWGTDIDFETAAALYRKATEQQYNSQAMFNLGYMHEKGLGMKKDWHLAKRLYDLAAETNADAKVPVALALLKLQILAKIESIKDSPFRFVFYLDENIAANWDLYIITILTLILSFILYTRRAYQQHEQERQQREEQPQQPNNDTVEQPQNNQQLSNTTLTTPSPTQENSINTTAESPSTSSKIPVTLKESTNTTNNMIQSTTTNKSTKSRTDLNLTEASESSTTSLPTTQFAADDPVD